ncbi:MAG: DUF5132 domain-containing protein [Anaerolineae bacterium]
MEDILVVILAVALLAMLPFVPGLRPIAKKIVVGSLAVVAVSATAAAVASEQWKDLVAEAQAERLAEAQTKALAAEVETITISIP